MPEAPSAEQLRVTFRPGIDAFAYSHITTQESLAETLVYEIPEVPWAAIIWVTSAVIFVAGVIAMVCTGS
jgi:hypothetical protein